MSIQLELERQNERLQLLLNLTNKITSNLDLRDVLSAIAGNIRTVMRGDLVGISIFDEATGKLRVYALDFPLGKGIVKEGLLITPTESSRRVIDSLTPLLINAADFDEFPPEVRGELVLAEGTKSFCILPLANRGRALGTLAIGRTTEIPFASDETEFLGQMAGQIAIALENALGV